MKQEYILCAAICNKEELDMAGNILIHCGHRHHNILWQSENVSRNPKHQGFLTSTGRFVDREEGLRIAINSGQVKPDYKRLLFSEDLY